MRPFTMRKLVSSLVAVVIVGAAACGSASSIDASSSATSGAAAGAGGASAGASGGGASGASAGKAGAAAAGKGGATLGCAGMCGMGQFCSASGSCLPEGTCQGDADCQSAGTICDKASSKCVPGGACGAKKIAAAEVPSNLLLVVDRSCSMTQKLANGKSKWEMAVAAISSMTKQFGTQIRFGLTMFPDKEGDKCTEESNILIPIGDATGPAISSLLQASLVASDPNFPSGPCSTPIDTGILQSNKDPGLFDATHPHYALLLTDGEQSAGCSVAGGAAGAAKVIANMKSAGISVFVVGFGGQVNAMQLDSFADAGGVPANPTSPKFYKAEDDASLAAALTAIAGKATGCVFALDTPPPDASMLYVFFDKTTKVPRDGAHATGWDYDAAKKQVTVYGSYCDSLKAGKVKVVDIVFGCDMAPE